VSNEWVVVFYFAEVRFNFVKSNEKRGGLPHPRYIKERGMVPQG
jgi:hypothetical protein